MSENELNYYEELSRLKVKYKALKETLNQYGPSSRMHIVDEHDMCRECGGSGYKLYGSTATWRGGIGGQAMTNDVCDYCWGSGSNSRPWPSWRKYEALERKVKHDSSDEN